MMISQRSMVENEVQQQGFIHAVYEQSPYGILVFNSAMEIIDWNPAVHKLTGLDREACIGKKINEVFLDLAIDSTTKAEVKGTLVIAETISSRFLGGMMGPIKISIIVDKSGHLNGGTLILTSRNG